MYGALTYDIIAAACSSPQTTEINATKRADTLMKWVNVGVGQAAIFAVIGAIAEQQEGNPVWPVMAGFGLAAGMMYVSYWHALESGLQNKGSGTETY